MFGWQAPMRVRQVIGWGAVALVAFILVWQVRQIVRKQSALPFIRHPVLLHERLYDQAIANADPAIATELAPFYLIERAIRDAKLLVARSLARWRPPLESVGRVHVKISKLVDVPDDAWNDLALQASHATVLGKRTLYLLAGDPSVKTYAFVATTGDTGPLFIMPEALYRSRVADKSGANLSAP